MFSLDAYFYVSDLHLRAGHCESTKICVMLKIKLEYVESKCIFWARSFRLPDGLRLPNLDGLGAKTGVEAGAKSGAEPGAKSDAAVHEAGPGSAIAQHFSDNIDASLTWSFVAWLRGVTSLPIFVKVSDDLQTAWSAFHATMC